MTLAEKVELLEKNALKAARLAHLWKQKIQLSGETEAERFYLSLGHNHIERKGVEWEGLKLSREPKEHEKLCLKGIANAQDSAKAKLTNLLLELRSALLKDAIKALESLKPKDYHKLVVQVPKDERNKLRALLNEVFNQGRRLVAQELSRIKQDEFDDFEDEDEELDTLAEVTDARVANDVQARIIGAATRLVLLGLAGGALLSAVQTEVEAGSVTYIDRAASGVGNKVISMGRAREAEKQRGEWDRVEYSAILDQNVCENCAPFDGQTAENEEDLEPVPNVACLGMDLCRCFHVYINQ